MAPKPTSRSRKGQPNPRRHVNKNAKATTSSTSSTRNRITNAKATLQPPALVSSTSQSSTSSVSTSSTCQASSKPTMTQQPISKFLIEKRFVVATVPFDCIRRRPRPTLNCWGQDEHEVEDIQHYICNWMFDTATKGRGPSRSEMNAYNTYIRRELLEEHACSKTLEIKRVFPDYFDMYVCRNTDDESVRQAWRDAIVQMNASWQQSLSDLCKKWGLHEKKPS